jgi:hypothetical protein
MKGVELYAQVRYAVQIEGVSRREAARRYGTAPRTVAKMLAFSVPPGYRRSRRPARPKLDPLAMGGSWATGYGSERPCLALKLPTPVMLPPSKAGDSYAGRKQRAV